MLKNCKRNSLAAVLIVASLLSGQAAFAKPKIVGALNFTDYFNVDVSNAPSNLNIVRIKSSGGVLGVPAGCNSGVCNFSIKDNSNGSGNDGTVVVMIGTDKTHGCQFSIVDGAYEEDPVFTSAPVCVGGYSTDGQISHQSFSYLYTINVTAPTNINK